MLVVSLLLCVLLSATGSQGLEPVNKPMLRTRYPLVDCGTLIESCITVMESHIAAIRQLLTKQKREEALFATRVHPNMLADAGSLSRVAHWNHQLHSHCNKVKLIATHLLANIDPVYEPFHDSGDVAGFDEDGTRGGLDQGDATVQYERDNESIVRGETTRGDGETSQRAGRSAHNAEVNMGGSNETPSDNPQHRGVDGKAQRGAFSSHDTAQTCSDREYHLRDIYLAKLEVLQVVLFLVNEIEEGSSESATHLDELPGLCNTLLDLYWEEVDLLGETDNHHSEQQAHTSKLKQIFPELSGDIAKKLAKFTEAVTAAAKNVGIDVDVVADTQYYELSADGRLQPILDKTLTKEEEVNLVVQELARAEARVKQQQLSRNPRVAEKGPSQDEELVKQLTEKLIDMWESDEYNKYIQVVSLSSAEGSNFSSTVEISDAEE